MARRPTEPAANPARGVALVVVAVLVGLFLLRNGLDTSETVAPTNSDRGSDVGTTDSAGADNTTSTTLGLRSPPDVPTIVLNGSGVAGAAKKYSTALLNKGYALTKADGDNATVKPATTQVLYTPGFEKEAAAVALLIGAPSAGVAPVGTTLPGTRWGPTSSSYSAPTSGPRLLRPDPAGTSGPPTVAVGQLTRVTRTVTAYPIVASTGAASTPSGGWTWASICPRDHERDRRIAPSARS